MMMRFDPSILIARTRAEAFEEAAQLAEQTAAPFTASAIRDHAAGRDNLVMRHITAKLSRRDNRITDCIEIDTPYPLADSGLDGI
jgi:hypothetical protein